MPSMHAKDDGVSRNAVSAGRAGKIRTANVACEGYTPTFVPLRGCDEARTKACIKVEADDYKLTQVDATEIPRLCWKDNAVTCGS
jgi:hypothetical protein